MKVLSASAHNFASYQTLAFTFDAQGLALIHGPTGAGKSTLCDLIPWCLFGKTAKNGIADDILAWPGTTVTIATVVLELNGECVHIERKRGPKAKDNDLYIVKDSGPDIRGKDIPDTQRLINDLLGFDSDLYLSGAYYHEFSKTAQFFNTSAKGRRELTEQLVDLSIVTQLQSKTSLATKALNQVIRDQEAEFAHLQSDTARLVSTLTKRHAEHKAWRKLQDALILQLEEKSTNFEANQLSRTARAKQQYKEFETVREESLRNLGARITGLQNGLMPQEWYQLKLSNIDTQISEQESIRCPTCAAPIHHQANAPLHYERSELVAAKKSALIAMSQIRDYERQEEEARKQVNPLATLIEEELYILDEYAELLIKARDEISPHSKAIVDLQEEILGQNLLCTHTEAAITKSRQDFSDLEALSDALNALRGILVKNTIVTLENSTNELLANHFDAEIQVSFTIESADKLEVSILKDGNDCSFTQLSKGQRQLLKLCFGVSAMRTVANTHGIKFNTIFFDEAFDGLDEQMKVKAYGLLKTLELEYDSVFIVEHSSALKVMFDKQFEVSLTAEGSKIGQS